MLDTLPKVLVVDDDPGMRVTLEGIVEDEGYDVVVAEDGYRAIELAKETPFSLIFMDLKMPGLNGVETYRQIKKVNPSAVVVMMTGFSIDELVSEAFEEGAYAVIHKPFAMDRVIDIVKMVMKTMCVLVVDDRAADREAIHTILDQNGYDVVEAVDGQEAVSKAADGRYGVILMDINMPGMDGVTACEEIRKLDPQVKVIFVTGYALEGPAREALSSGAYTVVTKPVDPHELVALMSSVTGQET